MEKKSLKVGETISPYGTFFDQYSVLELEELQEAIEDRIIVLRAKENIGEKGTLTIDELSLESEKWTK